LILEPELNAYDVLCNDWIVFTSETLPGGGEAAASQSADTTATEVTSGTAAKAAPAKAPAKKAPAKKAPPEKVAAEKVAAETATADKAPADKAPAAANAPDVESEADAGTGVPPETTAIEESDDE
jgi:hypothetical protein